MKKEIRSRIMQVGLIDAGLAELAFFEIDSNNIMPSIRRARIWYMQHFMESGQFHRQPVINIIFELPDGSYKHVYSWIKNGSRPRKALDLNREAIQNPEQLVCEILRAWNECERVWSQHIEQKIVEFEKSLAQSEVIVPVVLQFNRR